MFLSRLRSGNNISKAGADLNTDDLSSLNENKLPVLSFDQLINLLGQDNRMRAIKQLTGVGADHFVFLYKPVIENFVEACQLLPASASHHHSGLGGLVIHTLEVIERALKIRKKHELPQNTDPETIAAQEHVWTYGVFLGAILHDAAKLVTSYRLVLDNKSDWNPYGKRIHETGAKTYKIEFIKSPYGLHSKLGATFFYLIPAAGRQWIAKYTTLMAQLTSYLQNDPFEAGVIGDIVRESDGYSVAQNIKTGGDRTRLSNAPTIPLVDRLMTALRQLLENQEIKVNTSGGSVGWVEGAYTYMVCAVTADKIIGYLRTAGATDIPTDNTRIFDILQEHGFIVPNSAGKAVWAMKVIGPVISGKPSFGPYNLTMLKFETSKLFHPAHRPPPFDGKVVTNDTDTKHIDSEPKETVTDADNKKVDPETANNQQKPETDKYTYNSETTHNQQKSETDNIVNKHEFDPEDPFAPTNGSCASNFSSVAGNKHDSGTDINSVSDDYDPGAGPQGIMDPEIGKHFINWLRFSLENKKIKVNKPNARVHIVKEGVLLVTPQIFKEYIERFGLRENSDNEMEAVKRVQNRVQKLKLHIKTVNNMNFHFYNVVGTNKKSKINGYLFPISEIYKNIEPPKPNTFLSNSCKNKNESTDDVDN